MMPVIRRGGTADLGAVAAIQYQSPAASQWAPERYLQYELWVAQAGERIAGFLVLRRVACDEVEILNLAVDPSDRRKHIGEALFQEALRHFQGDVFLEVRESNEGAQRFYQAMGFQRVSVRQDYYDEPPEAAIVMKFHSC